MGNIVWSACTAHTAAMIRKPEGTDMTQANRVFGAFDRLSETLKASEAEILVIIGTDHLQTFSFETVPVFAIGTGTGFPTWGEAGTKKTTYAAIDEFSEDVIRRLIESEFDVVSATEMRLDHAFNCPLGFLYKFVELPVLPIYVNCTIAPLPSLKRCRAFGESLGAVLRDQTIVERIAIVGTGGLSHWVGTPQTGIINEDFDHEFLERIEAGDLDAMVDYDSDRVIEEAGNGAAEIRNWIIAAAAARMKSATRLAYEPVAAWKTGIGLVELAR